MKYSLEITLFLLILTSYAAHTVINGSHKINFTTDNIACLHSSNIAGIDNAVKSGNFENILRNVRCSSYPPLYVLGQYALALIFGRNWMLLNLIQNSFYLIIMLVFVYLLGRMIKNRATGIIGAVVLSLIPLVYETSIDFILDYALAGLMLMSVYFLLKSDMFNDAKWSVLFGIVCGWGLMLKEPFAIFIVGPMLYSFRNIISEMLKKNCVPLRNLLIAGLLTMAITAPYYMNTIVWNNLITAPSREATGIPWYNLNNLRFSIIGICDSQLSPPFFIAFIIGVYYFFRKTTKHEIKWVFILWILVPNIILLFMAHWKSNRYLLPVQPAYALIGAAGIVNLMKTWHGKAAVAMIFMFGSLQYFGTMYFGPLHPNSEKQGTQRKMLSSVLDHMTAKPYYLDAEKNNAISGMFATLSREMDLKAGGRAIRILVPSGEEQVYRWNIRENYFWFQNVKALFHVISPQYPIETDVEKIDFVLIGIRNSEDVNNRGYNMDYEFIKKCMYDSETNLHAKKYFQNDTDWKLFKELWGTALESFNKREKICSDGFCSIYLYKRG